MNRLQMEARLAGEGQPPTPGLVGPWCQCWPTPRDLGVLLCPLSFMWNSCVGEARKISGGFSWRWSPLGEVRGWPQGRRMSWPLSVPAPPAMVVCPQRLAQHWRPHHPLKALRFQGQENRT